MNFDRLQGWHKNEEEVEKYLSAIENPFFSMAAPNLVGDGENKTSLIYKAWKEIPLYKNRYPEYPAQVIGDCVSQGFARAVDLVSAIEIIIRGESEEYKETSTEALYGFARVDVGDRQLGNSDGAVGSWAARAINEIGVVSREDTGPYDGRKAKKWGFSGVPMEFKEKASKHKIRSTRLVTTYEELQDAIANGYPVAVCSSQGFTLERDSTGTCNPKGTWQHCMCIIGIRVDPFPSACILNSWGANVPSGPLADDQPPGSFWARRDVVSRMLAARDSWAVGEFDGYPARKIPKKWTHEGFAA